MNQFRVGSVLERSFKIYFKNIIPFLLISALVYLPYAIFLFSGSDAGSFDMKVGDELQQYNWIEQVMNLLVPQIATGAIIYGAFMELRGNHAGIGKCLSVGITRMLPVTVVAFFVALCKIAVFLPAVAMFFVSPGLALLFILIGLVFMAIVSMMLYVAVPVAVVERSGILGALRRSRELTRGNKAALFGLTIIIVILAAIGGIVVGALMGTTDPQGAEATVNLAGLIVAVLFAALDGVVSSVVYHDLRQEKDGVGVEELAAVFD